MAKIYADLIKMGLWTIDRVNERWVEEVLELLNS